MANNPYITEKTEAQMMAMADLQGIDEGRLYEITDLGQMVIGVSTIAWLVLYPPTLQTEAEAESVPMRLASTVKVETPTPSKISGNSGTKKATPK